MGKIYATATVPNYRNSSSPPLSLSPDIEEVLRTSTDTEELLHYWQAFRDQTGAKYRDLYLE